MQREFVKFVCGHRFSTFFACGIFEIFFKCAGDRGVCEGLDFSAFAICLSACASTNVRREESAFSEPERLWTISGNFPHPIPPVMFKLFDITDEGFRVRVRVRLEPSTKPV